MPVNNNFIKQSTKNQLQDFLYDFKGNFNQTIYKDITLDVIESEVSDYTINSVDIDASDRTVNFNDISLIYQIKLFANNNFIDGNNFNNPTNPANNSNNLNRDNTPYTREKITVSAGGGDYKSEGIWGSNYPYKIPFELGSNLIEFGLYGDPVLTDVVGASTTFIEKDHKIVSVFQESIAVIKDGNGNILDSNNSLGSNLNQGDTVTLDKSDSRGTTVSQYWIIEKWDSQQSKFVNASNDYNTNDTLGDSNNDGDDIINVELTSTNTFYRFILKTEGGSSSETGANKDSKQTFAQTNSTVVSVENNITFPIIKAKTNPLNEPFNLTKSNNPLVGYNDYFILVEPEFDKTNAKYEIKTIYQNTSNNTTDVILDSNSSNEDWMDFMKNHANITCEVRDKNGNVVAEKKGFGYNYIIFFGQPPQYIFFFVLDEGEYEVGFHIDPK